MIVEAAVLAATMGGVTWGWQHRWLRYGTNGPWRHYGTVVAPHGRRRLVIGRSLYEKHAAVWGGTGSGKSFLAAHIGCLAARDGAGLVVLDPHATMIDRLLMGGAQFLAPCGTVVLYPGSDLHRVVPWNPLHVAAGATPWRVAERFLGACARLWGLSMERTPRIWHVLSMSTAALAAAGYTPLEIVPFLEDAAFRAYIIARANLRHVTAWAEKFDAKNETQQEEQALSTIHRLRQLQTTPVLQQLVGLGVTDPRYRAAYRQATGHAPAPPADLAHAVAAGCHLLVALPEQAVGEYQFFCAALILDAVVRTVMQRDADHVTTRTELLLDEIGRLASVAPNLITVLAEARKYGCIAHVFGQGRYQVADERLRKELDGNTAIKLFGPTSLTDEAAAAGRMADTTDAKVWEQRVRELQDRHFVLIARGLPALEIVTPTFRSHWDRETAYRTAGHVSALPSIATDDARRELDWRVGWIQAGGYRGAGAPPPARASIAPAYLDDLPGEVAVPLTRSSPAVDVQVTRSRRQG